MKEHFRNLKELEEWILGQMCVDYSSGYGAGLLSFPKCDEKDRLYEISVTTEYGKYVFWIKMIKDDYLGIISSGELPISRWKHCIKMVKEWLAGCERRKNVPTFHFAPDETGANGDFKENILHECVDEPRMDKNGKNSGDDMVYGQVIRKVAKRIHEIGGCDAMDEYSSGYDAAISAALDILLRETGYTVEDVLDHDENREDEDLCMIRNIGNVVQA